jgi:hypothetical protein
VNRALGQEQAAGRAPHPTPAPVAGAPAAPPPESLNTKKLAEERPTSPAAPPASPKAELAKSDSKREAMLEPRDADKAAGRSEMQQAKQAAVATSSFTVDTPQVASTRRKARELLAKWNMPDANAAAADGKAPGPEPTIISVDLTPSQFAEFRKQLEVQSGARFVLGIPVEPLRDAGTVSGGKVLAGGVGGKPPEDPKVPQPATRGIASAPVKGAEAKPQAQGQGGEERKDRQAAEKAKESKEADALGAEKVPSGAEARQKFILYFREIPPEK